jgi:hypothetical protein
MAPAEVGFERDIRPLFRDGDVKAIVTRHGFYELHHVAGL